MDLIKCQFMTIIILLLAINIALVLGVYLRWYAEQKVCGKQSYQEIIAIDDISENFRTNRGLVVTKEYPYAVEIRVEEQDGLSAEVHCGGAITNAHWILTAAHCVDMLFTFSYKNIMIYGGNKLWKIEVKHEVVFMTYHQDYNNETFDSDIGLIKVKQPFRGNFERIVPLANKYYRYKVNRTVTAVGWFGDYYQEGYRQHDMLNSVKVLILNDKYCKSAYETVGENITDSMFCAGAYDGQKLACHLDSGGLLLHGKILIGIASWGRDCGKVDQPTVYTKVSLFTNWIYYITKIK